MRFALSWKRCEKGELLKKSTRRINHRRGTKPAEEPPPQSPGALEAGDLQLPKLDSNKLDHIFCDPDHGLNGHRKEILANMRYKLKLSIPRFAARCRRARAVAPEICENSMQRDQTLALLGER
jgi:hypothetical protein